MINTKQLLLLFQVIAFSTSYVMADMPKRPIPMTEVEDTIVIDDQDISNTKIQESALAPVLEKYNPKAITFEYPDFAMELFFKFQPEAFVGLWQNLLNHRFDADRSWFIRHSADVKIVTHNFFQKFGYDAVRTQMTIRNKGVWGNPGSLLQTNISDIKFGDALIGAHNHFIARHIFWMREAWIDIVLNAALGFESDKMHHVTVGLFPFQLGNAISLGDAYAVNPGLLGFYTDNVVDQYAPGIRIYGDAIVDTLKYDLYFEIVQSNSSSLKDTGAQIYAQQCGHRLTPERGFGQDNLIFAGRLNYTAFKDDFLGLLTLEPYFLYNRAPEQKVEFPADASSQLGTFGLAFNYTNGDFVFSLEGARNVGHQRVRCWDRNNVVFDFRDGVPTEVNSHIINQDDQKVVFVRGSAAQKIIDASVQSASQNGQLIGVADGQELFNADDRIRPCYTNEYKGWMLVSSMAYQVTPSINLALEGGIASGDANPNNDPDDPEASVMDGDYKGFIGLQEVFNGIRVQSAYVLGSRKLPRPLSLPSGELDKDVFADSLSEFTNIIYVGTGAIFKPVGSDHGLTVRPNLIAFWEERAGRKFDCATKTSLDECASRFLGVELNTFIDWYFFKNLKGYAVGSIFFPGQHYKDIRGTPMSKAQAKILSQADTTGIDEPLPLLWNDTAYSLNVGLEYRY